MITVSYGLGYWLAFLGFVAAAAASLLLMKGGVVFSEAPRPNPPPDRPAEDSPAG